MSDQKRQHSAKSPGEIEPIPEFDKTMRGIAGTPKEEVDQAERREKERQKKNGTDQSG